MNSTNMLTNTVYSRFNKNNENQEETCIAIVSYSNNTSSLNNLTFVCDMNLLEREQEFIVKL